MRKETSKRSKVWQKLLFLLFFCSFSLSLFPQGGLKVKGKVVDTDGNELVGVSVTIVSNKRGAITGNDGTFVLDDVAVGSKLLFEYLGMQSQEVVFENKGDLHIVMQTKVDELAEVSIVAFSKQKKESVLASISTVDIKDLRVPSSNLTTAFAGRVAGLISYQLSGEPGMDNASFFIRGITSFGAGAKKDPLILIDGMELGANELARLNTDIIQSFSVLKDASATALYGARGANGVILVTTKEGKEGKVQVQARFENSFSSPTRMIKTADPVTYMRMHNEAVKTRDPMAISPYTEEKIIMTERGLYPLLYPQTDWYDVMFDPTVSNQRGNISFSGGSSIAKYFVAFDIAQDHGNIKVDKRNNFNSNINLVKYNIRSNVNINLTKTTELVARLNVMFDEYTGPYASGEGMYSMVLHTNPVLFRPYYEPDEQYSYVKHILFGNYGSGNYGSGNYLNPYAESLKGYRNYSTNQALTQFELKQDLAMLTPGLKFRTMFNMDRKSEYTILRQYVPYYYNISSYDKLTGEYKLSRLNTNGRETLDYFGSGEYIETVMYSESALDWNRQYNEKHSLGGLLVFTLRQLNVGAAPSLQLSLPHRNIGISGRFTYDFDKRYFAEFDFGYNGSERFASSKRYGFFPAVALGWILTNESYLSSLTNTFKTLKLKGSYGMIGNDAIGSDNDRFYYLSQVEIGAGREINWGTQMNYNPGGINVTRYGNSDIGWETSYMGNLGFEFDAKFGLNGTVEVYHKKTINILQPRIIPNTMGILPEVKANLGVGRSQGVDLDVNYEKTVNKDLWFVGRGTFTYTQSRILEKEEPDYALTPWLSAIGRSNSQRWGYIAERLFIDDAEVANSPTQFGIYGAGDIKYRDVNGDGKISTLDQVPLGYPQEPELNFGFGLTAGYKGFDLSVFFSGQGRKSFWIDPYAIQPFEAQTTVMKVIADSYWSESNRDPYAFWPRLSETSINNNMQTSTWFMQDASFLRLKQAEFGYNIPADKLKKFKLANMRFYVSGTNLLSWSAFKLWDPEVGGNGLGYPLQRVINVGLTIGL